jgi:hypothetical protein
LKKAHPKCWFAGRWRCYYTPPPPPLGGFIDTRQLNVVVGGGGGGGGGVKRQPWRRWCSTRHYTGQYEKETTLLALATHAASSTSAATAASSADLPLHYSFVPTVLAVTSQSLLQKKISVNYHAPGAR